MVAAVQQSGFQAHHRIAGQHAVGSGLAQALFHCGEEVLGHAAAEYLLLEYQLFAVAGLELDPHIAELAVAAGLFLVTALGLELLADGFAVGDPGRGQLHLDAEFGLQAGADHIQMLLAQAGDHLLHRLGVQAVV